MTQTSQPLIAPVLQTLKQSVFALDYYESLDGLISIYFDTHSRLRSIVGWSSPQNATDWVRNNSDRLTEAPLLAILGCLISHCEPYTLIDQATKEAFFKGTGILKARKEDFSSPTSWILQPTVVLGIALGIRVLQDIEYQNWFVELVKRGMERRTLPLMPRLLYMAVLSLFSIKVNKISPFHLIENVDDCSLPELSLGIWLGQREIGDWKTEDRLEWLSIAQKKYLERLILEPVYESEDYKAALLWIVATDCINQTLIVPNATEHVAHMLQNIPFALERWKPNWKIEDEADLQRITFLVLRTHFDDLKYEENLPKLGRSGHRYDIGIPHLRLLLELKFGRAKSDFQKFVEEIGQDVAQLQTQTMFTAFMVFIYDISCSTEQYGWTRNAILDFSPVKDCVIVCAPSVAR